MIIRGTLFTKHQVIASLVQNYVDEYCYLFM